MEQQINVPPENIIARTVAGGVFESISSGVVNNLGERLVGVPEVESNL